MSYTLLVPPAPGDCISDPGELTALVTQAVPGTSIGLVWYGATAPDVVTYSYMTRFLWVDTSVSPPVERHWDPGTLSWVQDLPADGSIVNAMIADYTIQLVKLSPIGGTAGYVLRLNGAGTQVVYDDPQNLFSYASPLSVAKLGRPTAGTWILSSDGTTNAWAAVSSIVQTATILLSQLDDTGAVSPQVLSFKAGTVAFRDTVDVTDDGTFPITKLEPGPANYILGTNGGGTARVDLSPAQVYDLIKAYITAAVGGYVTADVDLTAIPAAATAQNFAHGFSAAPKRQGAFIKCTDAGGDGTYSLGDIIPWDDIYDVSGDAVNNWGTASDATNVVAIRPNNGGGLMVVSAKDGSAHNEFLTAAKWKVGAWAYAN